MVARAAAVRSLVLAVALGPCLPAHAQEAVAELGPAAAGQTLLVRGSTDIEVFEPILEAYLQAYPQERADTRIRYEQWATNALYERAARDCEAESAADLLISSALDQQVRLVNDGCALPHRSAETRRLPGYSNWRDEVFGITREPAVIVYNRAEVTGDDIPKSRFDLIDLLRPYDTRFSGRVATYDIERSGLGYLFAFADAQQASTFGALLEAFGRSGAVATCCSAELIDAVADGRYLIAYNVLGSYALARADTDPRIGVVAPEDYTLVLSRAALIPRGARLPEEARRLLDFLLSERGQAAMVKARLIATFDENDTSDVSPTLGVVPVLRPIALSPTLLVGLDRMKRELFVREWREKMDR